MWTARVVIIGDPGVGKSALLMRYSDGVFPQHYTTTMGVDFKTHLDEDKDLKLQLWDISGHKQSVNVATAYFQKAHLLLVVYDVTQEQSFLNVQKWMQEIQNSGASAPVLLVANKANSDQRVITKEQGQALSETLQCVAFYETDAKTDFNVKELFSTSADIILAKKENLNFSKSAPTLKESIDAIRGQYKHNFGRFVRSAMTFGVFGFGSDRKTSLRILLLMANKIAKEPTRNHKEKENLLLGLLLDTYFEVMEGHCRDRWLNTNKSSLAECIGSVLKKYSITKLNRNANSQEQVYQEYKKDHLESINLERNNSFLVRYFRA